MNKQPLLSIIIPTYNRADLILDTLVSIQQQTYTNWECIIIDDGSTDHTKLMVDEFITNDSRFQYHVRPKTRLPGGNAARNYGYELSKGEYIQWFDSDDIMHASKLQRQIEQLIETNADFSVVEGVEFITDPNSTKKKWILELPKDILLQHVKGNIVFGTNGPVFKKSYLNTKQALFNENLRIRQEWEFFSRLLMDNPHVVIINEPLYAYRSLAGGIRSKLSYEKLMSRMKSERLVLDRVNETKPFSIEDDRAYRIHQFAMAKLNRNRLIEMKKYQGLLYVMRTFFKLLTPSFAQYVTQKFFKNPGLIKRIHK